MERVTGPFGFWHRKRLVVERADVVLTGLAPAFDDYRIAFLTDLHYSPVVPRTFVARAVSTALALEPDLVLLGGDFLSHSGRYAAGLVELLRPLAASDGVFGVLGNHDHESDPRLISRSLETRGVTVLRNFNLRVEKRGERFWIAGVDDVLGGGANLNRALQGAEGFTVLLAHEPDYADRAAGYPVDLQLSGHSHGGQVWLPLVGSPYLPPLARKYPRGLRQVGTMMLYTNRGVGTIIVPIRFNCPPEITLLTLRRGSRPS